MDGIANAIPLHSTRPGRVKQIWAIGGGKGGVGKSLISSSLAIALARQNLSVIAIDLDLGGANLHTTLGIDLPKQSLTDFFSGRVAALEAIITPTGIPHLGLISGAQDSMTAAYIQPADKERLFEQCHDLNADCLVLDLGAGTSDHTLDFFLFADVGLVAVLPEPTSIENAYRFIKSAYLARRQIPHRSGHGL
jgi:flagellar biosynthesis protein FlhG